MTSKRFLVFLLPVLVVSLIYGYLQMPRQERVASGDKKFSQRPQLKKKQTGQPSGAIENNSFPRLRSDLLERKSQSFPGVRRDLFSNGFSAGSNAAGKTAPPEELPELIVPPVTVAVVPPPPPPPSPQEVARQELSRYKFLGFFKKGEKQTIFLASADQILLVRKGEYLGRDRKYYVLNVTDKTLELRKVGIGDFLIKLTDQESLSAVSFQTVQTVSPGTSGQPRQEQEINLPDQPEILPVPDEELPTEDQLRLEEDKS